MRRDEAVCKSKRAGVWLLLFLFSVVGCSDNPTDPKQVFGFRDATDSNLLAEVEEAIEVANATLAVEGRFALRPTWKPSPSQIAVRDVPVYLLRHPGLGAETGVTRTRETLKAFRAELAKTKLSPELEHCNETDPCAALMYAGTQMKSLVADVYHSLAIVDAAATEMDCRCVILIEDDLRKFKLIFGPSIQDGEPIVPLTWYVPWYALHEIGHLDTGFRMLPGPAWADLYRRTQSGLNAQQQEEMRADAYAASALRRACLVQPRQEVRDAVAQGCYGIAIQVMQLWFYGIFDKTAEGSRRQYLDEGKTHPNALMRLLAANVVMTDGSRVPASLLMDFMDKREIFAQRFALPSASSQ